MEPQIPDQMRKLPEKTIERIKRELTDQGIRNKYLLAELTDHVASDMEQMMNQGISEQEAWNKTIEKRDKEEISGTASVYGGILNTRFYRVKLLLWITFILFAFSWLTSSRLSLYTGTLSFISLGITLIAVSIDFFRSRKNHSSNLLYGTGTLLSALLVMSGFILLFCMVLFQVNTRGHGVDLMIFSYLAFSIVAFFYFIRQKKLAVSDAFGTDPVWFISFSGIQLLLALLAFLSLPLYSWARDYIWILVWIILVFDGVSLVLLIVKRIRNILFLALLLISFMITFIHSPLGSLIR